MAAPRSRAPVYTVERFYSIPPWYTAGLVYQFHISIQHTARGPARHRRLAGRLLRSTYRLRGNFGQLPGNSQKKSNR
jgi:hypothetical protein